MANSSKDIKRRIRSVSSTLQITKALELISSIKMRQAVKAATSSRDFAGEIWQLITKLYEHSDSNGAKLPPLFRKHTGATHKNLLIIVAGDKGLAGSFNSNILKQAKIYLRENKDAEIDVVAVGKKARKIKQINDSVNIISDFENSGSSGLDFFEASPISKLAIDTYLDGQYDKVTVIYSHFINTLRQLALIKDILPINRAETTIENKLAGENSSSGIGLDNLEFKYEPDRLTLLMTLGRIAVRSQIYQALLESSASEHAARMVAMKNATENGNELVTDLKFTYNQLRQQNITRELSEIAAGAAAIQ